MLDSTLKNHNFDLLKHIANANNPKFNWKNQTWFFHIGLAFQESNFGLDGLEEYGGIGYYDT
jgi:hypothetical protein